MSPRRKLIKFFRLQRSQAKRGLTSLIRKPELDEIDQDGQVKGTAFVIDIRFPVRKEVRADAKA